MIITKARDNHLIKLTRELAIWLMNTPRNRKETGLVVYVDAQLRQSKRFDADGIKRDYPHLFLPILSRTSSYSDTETEANGKQKLNEANGKKSSEADGGSSSNSSRLNSISHTREDNQLRYWTGDMCSRSPHLFDFVVTLGGDGTVLFCSWLFQRIVPPVIPFALGSLGFLTNFDYSHYKKVLTSALDDGIRVNLRMRFTATVYRATSSVSSTLDRKKRRAIRSGKTGEIIMRNIQEGGWNRIESPLPAHGDLRGTFTEGQNGESSSTDRPAPANPPADVEEEVKSGKRDKEVMCFSTRPVETFEVLNDLVVDRGPSPYVSLLEVFGDEHHMTTAQADGLCISTPTGSTAYSLSAGGSLVHPEIPAILITPICPHTLSFRPMQLPDSMELRIAVPYNSRSTAWASFDGRGRVELKQGDHIKVTASKYPFPTVCAENQSIDWFQSISRTLKWNERQRQKSFVVVEEGEEEQETGKKQSQTSSKNKSKGFEAPSSKDVTKARKTALDGDDEDDEDDDAEPHEPDEEEAFDIDDTSTVATRVSSPALNKEKHHHHHRRHSSHGNGRLQTASSGSSTPLSVGSSQFLNKLQPLTLTNPRESKGDQANSAKANSVKFDDGSTSTNVPSEAQSMNRESSQSNQSEDSNDSSPPLNNYQHGIIQAPSRSLLDSPDRFGIAGPPLPPRALSERHLATADFRLDDNSDNKIANGSNQAAPSDSIATTITSDKKKSRSRSNSKYEPLSNVINNEGSGSAAPLLESGKPSKTASRLYKKLRGKAKSDRASLDASGIEGFDLSRKTSRGSGNGTALVVYGQDESDSDSTAEA